MVQAHHLAPPCQRPFWLPRNTRRHCTIFTLSGDLAPGICEALLYCLPFVPWDQGFTLNERRKWI